MCQELGLTCIKLSKFANKYKIQINMKMPTTNQIIVFDKEQGNEK